jgi:hypothetical protein
MLREPCRGRKKEVVVEEAKEVEEEEEEEEEGEKKRSVATKSVNRTSPSRPSRGGIFWPHRQPGTSPVAAAAN